MTWTKRAAVAGLLQSPVAVLTSGYAAAEPEHTLWVACGLAAAVTISLLWIFHPQIQAWSNHRDRQKYIREDDHGNIRAKIPPSLVSIIAKKSPWLAAVANFCQLGLLFALLYLQHNASANALFAQLLRDVARTLCIVSLSLDSADLAQSGSRLCC